MKRSVALLVLLAAVAVPTLPAGAKDRGLYYAPATLDLTQLLPPPPNLNSPRERADQRALTKVIRERSAAQVAVARMDSKRTVFAYAALLGPAFTPRALPLTSAFYQRVGGDVETLVERAKAYWRRPRPGVATKKRGSYPSGHAAFAAASAILLGQMLPKRREAIFASARAFAENRIILGVHYPTDVAAGWTAGTVIVAAMMERPKFQADYAASRAELRRVLGLP